MGSLNHDKDVDCRQSVVDPMVSDEWNTSQSKQSWDVMATFKQESNKRLGVL